MANIAEIYNWFMTRKKPTQAQFWEAWGSFWNKEEQIPQSSISNLTAVLNAKTENDQFNAHKVASDAHADLFDEKEDKTQKGVSGGYAPLDEFSKISHQFLSIVNNLIDGTASDLLSGEQGVVLQTQINAINTLLTSNDVNLDTVQEIVNAIKIVETSLSTILVNDLTTGGTTKALTAEMGKLLEDVKLTAVIATDVDTQITNAIAEDNKVVSRSKLFNWWEWAKTRAQTISAVWTFYNQVNISANATFTNILFVNALGASSGAIYGRAIFIGVRGSAQSGVGIWADSDTGVGLRINNAAGNTSNLFQFGTNSVSGYIDYLGILNIPSVNINAGTSTTPSLKIPNGVLTTVPQNGAIERDSNGFLWETHNGVRSRISTQTVSSDWTNITLLNDTTANRARYRTNGDMVEIDLYILRINSSGTSQFGILPSEIAPTNNMFFMGYNVSKSLPVMMSIINGNLAAITNTAAEGLAFTFQYKRF